MEKSEYKSEYNKMSIFFVYILFIFDNFVLINLKIELNCANCGRIGHSAN